MKSTFIILIHLFVFVIPHAVALEQRVFTGETIAQCEASFDDYLKQKENGSQISMNIGATLQSNCFRKVMNHELDRRLLSLKKSDRKQFNSEMDLQKDFNKSTIRFSNYYSSQCEGSACAGCQPEAALMKLRTELAQMENTKALELSQVSASSERVEVIRLYFESFASGLCQLPGELWKHKISVSECSGAVLSIITDRLKFVFAAPENEGEICAQLVVKKKRN